MANNLHVNSLPINRQKKKSDLRSTLVNLILDPITPLDWLRGLQDHDQKNTSNIPSIEPHQLRALLPTPFD